MTELPAFAKWPSIQRLSSETCFVTEKIDGTNGVIYVPECIDQPVLAGSRERWLTHADGEPPTKQEDNFGFGRWVHERSETLRQLGPGYHYGEFHGSGIQRNYDLLDRRWASFEYWRTDLDIVDVCVVPVLYEGSPDVAIAGMPVWDFEVQELREEGSVLYPGFPDPEGVVITFKNMNKAKFKRLCQNDLIRKSQVAK
jgi:hypothetical protein